MSLAEIRLWDRVCLWCFAGFAITTWHDIHTAMGTLPMTMNPDNIFRPPTRWALWLQNWLWLGFICCCCLTWHLLINLGLVHLGQLSHWALGWCGGVGSNVSMFIRVNLRKKNYNKTTKNTKKAPSQLRQRAGKLLF